MYISTWKKKMIAEDKALKQKLFIELLVISIIILLANLFY